MLVVLVIEADEDLFRGHGFRQLVDGQDSKLPVMKIFSALWVLLLSLGISASALSICQ